MTQIPVEIVQDALRGLLDETFDNVHGIYLDPNDSLMTTLADVSAELASRRIAPSCACLAAQVEHVAYYLERIVSYARGEDPGPGDWAAAWRREGASAAEWAALLDRLRACRDTIRALIDDPATFDHPDAAGGAMAAIVHTAYHLGEIRQGLGVLRR